MAQTPQVARRQARAAQGVELVELDAFDPCRAAQTVDLTHLRGLVARCLVHRLSRCGYLSKDS